MTDLKQAPFWRSIHDKPNAGKTKSRSILIAAIVSAGLLASGCSDSDDNDDDTGSVAQASFDITITNLSAGQPLSPAAVILHTDTWQSFSTGSAASVGLEHLAEGGDNSLFIADANAEADVYMTGSGTGIIAPGASETISLSVNEDHLGTLSFSAVSMLVNTNDAIAAINNQSLASMTVNESQRFEALSYDAGTEANSETADSIPGPAATGGLQEGFNATRDDVRDAVYVHAGVVTQSDGLASSTLNEDHRWDHPSLLVTVERTE